MLKIYDYYQPRANSPTTSYPNGSVRNQTVPDTATGTPVDQAFANDQVGFSEALLAYAVRIASGAPDTALTSDRLEAMKVAVLRSYATSQFAGGDESNVGVLTNDTVVDALDYVVYPVDLTIWATNGATGTSDGTLNTGTGEAGGISGVLTPVSSNFNDGTAEPSNSVLNVVDAALQRYNVTTQGAGAGNVIQGFCVDPYAAELYTLHVTGSPEQSVINKFDANGSRTQTSTRWNSTPDATVGHQQLQVSWDASGTRWFWTGENESASNSARYAKRFQIADGAGTELTISNVGQYQLFPDSVTVTASSTPCVSLDGRYLIAEYNGPSDVTRIRVFDLVALNSGGPGDYSDSYLKEFAFSLDASQFPLQGIASDGSVIYLFCGNIVSGPTLKVFVYTMDGKLINTIDDFTVGETEAQGDGAGTAYEMEGAGWVWHGGEPRLSVLIASGDSGNRTNRIWSLGSNLAITGYGSGDVPAFIAAGTNDFAVPTGETMRFGSYSNESGFDEMFSIKPDKTMTLPPENTGAFTFTAEDSATKSVGNVSSTVGNGHWSRVGNLMFVEMTIFNIDTTGMTGANNLYLHPDIPVGSNFEMSPPSDTPATCILSDAVLPATTVSVAAMIEDTGFVTIRRIRDSNTNETMDVSDFSGSDIQISGVFMV